MIADITGASFTALTVNVKTSASVNDPSVTVKVKSLVPSRLANGVTVAVQAGNEPENTTPETGITPVFVLATLIDVVQSKTESTSEIVNANGTAVSSFVPCGPTAKIIGASLIAFTVKTKLSASTNEPSETVNVKFTLPF